MHSFTGRTSFRTHVLRKGSFTESSPKTLEDKSIEISEEAFESMLPYAANLYSMRDYSLRVMNDGKYRKVVVDGSDRYLNVRNLLFVGVSNEYPEGMVVSGTRNEVERLLRKADIGIDVQNNSFWVDSTWDSGSLQEATKTLYERIMSSEK